MDLQTVAVAVSSSLGLSLAGAYWLARALIQHRLAAELERTKADLQQQLAREKAQAEGAVRREVEAQLGQMAAQRQYEYEARRRLYLAIGPLRFQLLLACRDLSGRIAALGSTEPYRLTPGNYYGRSTLFRLLRPLAIAELIERQVGVADFAVDPAALICLRFRRSLVRILSGDELVEGRSDLHWDAQVEHVFADTLAACAQVLISSPPGGGSEQVLRFDAFEERLQQQGSALVAPFDTLLQGFSKKDKPVLWLRLVAYGNACNALIDRLGGELGFERRVFATEGLLVGDHDPFVVAHRAEVVARVRALELVAL